MLASSTTRRALFTGMLRFSTSQTMIFVTTDGAILNMKILICTTENLTIPLDRAHRVLFGTEMEPLKQLPRRIGAEITRIGCQLHLRILTRESNCIPPNRMRYNQSIISFIFHRILLSIVNHRIL
jgi:hypothetical protein